MFDSLTGELRFPELNTAVVQVGGVAFRCFVSANTRAQLADQKEGTLLTHLNVREDALELFGFATQEERSCFLQLITVSGVGPKAAFAILSVLSPTQLANAVTSGDVKTITRANGVGPKVAQRVVLELKDKLKGFAAGGTAQQKNSFIPPDADDEAVAALMVLGYSEAEAAEAVAANHSEHVEETIRQALKSLAKKN